MRSILVILICFVITQTSVQSSQVTSRNDNDRAWHILQGVLHFHGQPFNGVTVQHENGDSVYTSYVNGLQQGEERRYYSAGQRQSVRYFEQGKKQGLHKAWWPHGNLKFEYHFLDDVHHGSAKTWHPNGQLASLFQYEHGYEMGLQQMWFDDGSVRAQYQMKNGRRYGWMGSKLCQ